MSDDETPSAGPQQQPLVVTTLRPCPFCDRTAFLYGHAVVTHSWRDGTKRKYVIGCTDCNIEMEGWDMIAVFERWQLRETWQPEEETQSA